MNTDFSRDSVKDESNYPMIDESLFLTRVPSSLAPHHNSSYKLSDQSLRLYNNHNTMPNLSAGSSWLETIDQRIDIARLVSERNRENRRAVESWFLSSPIRNSVEPVNTSTEKSCNNLTIDVPFQDIPSDESSSETELRSMSDFSKQEQTLQETLLLQDIADFERIPIRRHSNHDQDPTAYFSNTTAAEQELSPISVHHSIYAAEDTKLPTTSSQMVTGFYNTAPVEHSSDDTLQSVLNTIPMKDNTSSSSTLPRRNFKLSMDSLLHAFSKFTVCGQPSVYKTETYDTTFDISDDDGHLSVNSLSTETGVNISYCSR